MVKNTHHNRTPEMNSGARIKDLSVYIVSSLILLILLLYGLYIMEQEYLDRLESYKLYNGLEFVDADYGINGLYFIGEDYYCIKPKERDYSSEEKTLLHEHCHYLIDNDEDEHFCNGDENGR